MRPGATAEEIDAAYRQKAKAAHPEALEAPSRPCRI
ncbi:hypothetical protein TA3x_005074 [Tundrisphaera sp. TA3]